MSKLNDMLSTICMGEKKHRTKAFENGSKMYPSLNIKLSKSTEEKSI